MPSQRLDARGRRGRSDGQIGCESSTDTGTSIGDVLEHRIGGICANPARHMGYIRRVRRGRSGRKIERLVDRDSKRTLAPVGEDAVEALRKGMEPRRVTEMGVAERLVLACTVLKRLVDEAGPIR